MKRSIKISVEFLFLRKDMLNCSLHCLRSQDHSRRELEMPGTKRSKKKKGDWSKKKHDGGFYWWYLLTPRISMKRMGTGAII